MPRMPAGCAGVQRAPWVPASRGPEGRGLGSLQWGGSGLGLVRSPLCQLLLLPFQLSVQEAPAPFQPHPPLQICLPRVAHVPTLPPRPLLPSRPCAPRLARGLPRCCSVTCGRGSRPRCRCPGGVGVPACRMGLPPPSSTRAFSDVGAVGSRGLTRLLSSGQFHRGHLPQAPKTCRPPAG